MTHLLKELKDIVSECCITIILNTHRNKQQYDLDRLQLRKLVTEVEKSLSDTKLLIFFSYLFNFLGLLFLFIYLWSQI
ncbi:MAG: hypothetical protein ACKO7P_02080 [Bacteroidota bacterium]